jgi:hypothetical protein
MAFELDANISVTGTHELIAIANMITYLLVNLLVHLELILLHFLVDHGLHELAQMLSLPPLFH